MFSLITSYEDAWKAVIMPPRQEYTAYDLGPIKFGVKQNKIQRVDLQLRNRRGYTLECSFYQQTTIKNPCPCIIYLHGSGGSRLEALQYLEIVLSHPFSFFCFDFTGSGKSEGAYSTVGWYEQEDLDCVIEFLRNTGKVSKIALWGRSMGATTSIFYGAKHSGIECMILDSPFANFKKFVKGFIKEKSPLPGFLAGGAYDIIRSTIQKKAGFDLSELKPIKQIHKIKIPLLFGVGEGDTFVPIEHTIDLHAASRGEKKILHVFEGDHNSTRPILWLKYVNDFLTANLLASKKESSPTDRTKSRAISQSPFSASVATTPKELNLYSNSLPGTSYMKVFEAASSTPTQHRVSTPTVHFVPGQINESFPKEQKVYYSKEDIFKRGSPTRKSKIGDNHADSSPTSQRYKGPSIIRGPHNYDHLNNLSKDSFTSYSNSASFGGQVAPQDGNYDFYAAFKKAGQKTGPKLVNSNPKEMISKGDKSQKPEIPALPAKLRSKDEEVPPSAHRYHHHRAASSISGSVPTSANTSGSYIPHYTQAIEQIPSSNFSLASLNLQTTDPPSMTSMTSDFYSDFKAIQPGITAQNNKSSLSACLIPNSTKNTDLKNPPEISFSDPHNRSPLKRQNVPSYHAYDLGKGLTIKTDNIQAPFAHQNLQIRTPNNNYNNSVDSSFGSTHKNFDGFSHISTLSSTSATNSYNAANIKFKGFPDLTETELPSSYDDKYKAHHAGREYISSERKLSADTVGGQKSRFHTNRS